ncbi:sensor histidine kinase [Sphingomonas hengshuiensis]|uniref:histidine kinase n=1 Tax=Sphingomonas hengshuiensis TaxID=1609977 RepID=A0A7U5BFP2_9SPHN|nr:signal protein [Sphingomonas hengshuiensis]
MRRFLPTSLAGQIALLVAIALFVAQAINFGMLLRERHGMRFAQFIVPTVTRLADASERMTSVDEAGRPPLRAARDGGRSFRSDPRTRIEIHEANPIAADARSRPDIEEDVRRGLKESGIDFGRVIASVQPIEPDAPQLRRMSPMRAERLRRLGAELQIAVEIPGKGWLATNSPWPRVEGSLMWQLLAQTLILYVCVLIPVLLAGRRIAAPLRALATAARGFRPGDGAPPLEERGPGDVRAVIGAYNALGLRVNAMIDEKDRMLGAIGHDLRTPLAALRVRIESVEDDDDRNRMADTIDEMNRTLDDILSLARLGRPSEPATDVDMAALIDAVVEDFRDIGNDVSFEESPRLKMRMRPSLMRRAVRNLIENAVKYAGAAEVRLLPGETTVAIEVADRGPGIPADKLTAVFDPFTRLETSRNRDTGGIGLGLALARAIVSDAGGQITLANRAGGGLLATITLPRG